MKIIAYMPVHNEVDVLPWVLAHMHEQGIRVHALDGWSTDGSYELLQCAGAGVTVERSPAERDDGIWNCRRTLARIEQLAAESDADWCYLSDADEFRRTLRPDETLAEGIARIDAQGFNVIDHIVFAFFCTDGNWRGNPETYFRYYNRTDMICRIPQEKAWKNLGRVNLVDRGGHVVKFPGKNVAPEKFIMKHYPFRTPTQARMKLATRLARRCHEEHRDGWGVHYDAQFPPTFCWDPAKLKEWPAGELVAA